jgi:uncharacterized membrane protein
VRPWGLVPVALLVGGAALVAFSLEQGGASLAIVVVVPVLYGRSLEFVAGALVLVAGLFTLPLAFEPAVPSAAAGGSAAGGEVGAGSGGVILLGPVPIVFGTWKGISSRTRRWLAILGGAVLVAAVVLFLLVTV